LAAELLAAGIPVTYFADAAIAYALSNADVVLVGADAIAATWFLNKTGTRMLAAAATQQGVPVYVVASRDKFAGRELAARLVIRSGEPAEVWDSPPEGVDVRNPYFESIPLDLVTGVISDLGILGTGMIPDVCEH
jgi:translation initiation factor eIF-2B subunit delta